MALRERIQDDLKSALKGGRKDALRALRMLQAGLKNREIELRRPLEDDDVLKVIQGAVKQRKDSIAQYEAGGRDDLVAQERAELDVLSAYLPEQLGQAELEALVDAAIAEVGASGPKDMGAVMKRALALCAGRADGAAVNALVRAKLA
jgi:uncharacterized protein YqeY